MCENFKDKVIKLFKYAERLGLPTVAAIKNESGHITTYCSKKFMSVDQYDVEKTENIFLMIKYKGDLNKFLLKKSKIDEVGDEQKNFFITNPQILKTKH